MSNVVRVSKIDLKTILAQPNPQIDLRLEAYNTSTRNFLKAVSNYTQRAVTEITQRKAHYGAHKNKILDKTKQVENETNNCKVKEIELMAVLESEQEERKEAEQSVAALRRQLASLKDKCASLDVEIEQHRAVAQNLERERNREKSLLEKHAARISPELMECERRLQCFIEGIDKDKILVRFTHVDKSDRSREYSFVLDVSSRLYKVPTTSPYLPTLPILLDQLNESRDVYAFIKQMRQAFEGLASHGR
ncbi:Kinetochore protein SPC25 [Abortiporus biennis]